MRTYVKLIDGRIMVIWSENSKAETLTVYHPDCQWPLAPSQLHIVSYGEVLSIDTNLAAL